MKKIIILVCVLMLSACSTKFAYKNLDWLVYWYIDDYIELTNEQEEVFDIKLKQWLDWHKANELPKYVAHIKELNADVINQTISLERTEYHQDKARGHWETLRAHIVNDAVEMAPMLSDEQVTYLFAALEKQNQEREDELAERAQENPQKRFKKSLKRNLKEAKQWLGKLNNEQEKLIENTLPQFHSNSPLWLAYTRTYQNDLRSLFVSGDRGEVFKSQLKSLLLNPEQFRSEELNLRSEENGEIYKNMLLALLALSTEKQREAFVDASSDYMDDFVDLMEK